MNHPHDVLSVIRSTGIQLEKVSYNFLESSDRIEAFTVFPTDSAPFIIYLPMTIGRQDVIRSLEPHYPELFI
jgi:hypothetical protein